LNVAVELATNLGRTQTDDREGRPRGPASLFRQLVTFVSRTPIDMSYDTDNSRKIGVADWGESKLITIKGLNGIPLIREGDDLGGRIVQAGKESGVTIESGDVVVVTQKVVSKAEGRIVDLSGVRPSTLANSIALQTNRDPRHIEVILQETSRIVRMKDNHLIVETKHGFVCANAGIDRSNVEGEDQVSLLPVNPDKSAERIRRRLKQLAGADVAVIISDTFGRAWRMGHVNFAIGVAGMKPMRDYRGEPDMFDYTLRVTVMAVADELASAAELVMNKRDRVPVAIIKGYRYPKGEGSAGELVRPIEEDLFR